jgi:hypothetical protein
MNFSLNRFKKSLLIILMSKLKFNTDVSSYKIEEIFELLDINIVNDMDSETLKNLIKTNSNKLIENFNSLGKTDISTFFSNVQSLLIGDNTNSIFTTSEKLLIDYGNYKPFMEGNINGDLNDMYNNNNGAGNPIHRKTVTKLLNIDSKFRNNYYNTTSTNYMIDLPYPINNVIEMKLSDLEFPTTYYPISSANLNNYFWFATYTPQQIIDKDPDIYYLYIKDGHYYFDNLITDINTNLKNMLNIDNPTQLGISLPISMSFDLNYNNLGGVGNGTGIVSFGVLPSDASNNLFSNIVQLDLNFSCPPLPGATISTQVLNNEYKILYYTNNITPVPPIEQRLGWMFGYRHSYYGGAMYYNSESILDVIGPRYLFLIVNDFNKSNNVNFLTSSKKGLLQDNIIARISLKGAAFNIQSQNDYSIYSEPRYYYGPVNINKLEISVIDEFGRILSLNNNDFSFTLKMITIYSAT